MGEAEIIRALTKFVKKNAPQQDIVCTVTEVNLTDLTCLCSPVNGDADIVDVRLITGTGKGFVIIPKVASVVTVSFLNDATGYVSQFSTLDEIQLNGVNYRGLVKVDDLVSKLNALETRVNLIATDLLAIATAFLTPPNDTTPQTGATIGAIMNAAIVNISTPLTPTIRANLENTTVKHGNGL